MADDKDSVQDDAAQAGEGDEALQPIEDEASGGMDAKKLLLIIGPILLIGIGAALYFTGVFDSLLGKGDETHVEAGAEGGHGGGGEHGEGEEGTGTLFMELPDLLVNLSSSNGAPRFLKLKVKLEVNEEADIAKLEAVSPRVIDQFQTFLREMRVQDLRGAAGIYRLRQELLYRVNLAAAPLKVKDVLFQEILIQ